MKNLTQKRSIQFLLTLIFCGLVQGASAAGFADDAGNMIKNIRTGIYTVVGIAAGLALLWQFVEGWSGRKSWSDILGTAMWIIGAGAAITLATWLFTKGGSMTFG